MQAPLSNETLITVGSAVAVIMVVVPITWKMSGLFRALQESIERLTDTIDGHIEHKDLVNWIRLTRAKNPELNIPLFPEKE